MIKLTMEHKTQLIIIFSVAVPLFILLLIFFLKKVLGSIHATDKEKLAHLRKWTDFNSAQIVYEPEFEERFKKVLTKEIQYFDPRSHYSLFIKTKSTRIIKAVCHRGRSADHYYTWIETITKPSISDAYVTIQVDNKFYTSLKATTIFKQRKSYLQTKSVLIELGYLDK